MKSIAYTFGLICLLMSCAAQDENAMDEKNPLLCDPDGGVCEVQNAQVDELGSPDSGQGEKLRIVYFTDPICSSCWGIEPQLRMLKLKYGAAIQIEYRMGGLLPDWSYNSGGISKPSDVAHHWDEVSVYYDMPIDGDIWLNDPLDSSYPPSIAFKAAQLQDEQKAAAFLRLIREMVFLEQKNIAKLEHLTAAALACDLDPEQLKRDMEGKAKVLFQQDLNMAREFGVRGFPSIFFLRGESQQLVHGSKPFETYEAALKQLLPEVVAAEINTSWDALFAHFPTLTAREFAELSGTLRKDSEAALNDLVDRGVLDRFDTKNGSIWRLLAP